MISFWVPGIPQPGGSKKGFYSAKLGRVIITEDAKHNKTWRASVVQCAAEVAKEILEGPLKVRFEFYFVRPKGHYGSGKNVGVRKSSAPAFPAGRPDTTKLIRSTEDALKGVLWRDDSQIVTQYGSKRYAPQAGAMIHVSVESE